MTFDTLVIVHTLPPDDRTFVALMMATFVMAVFSLDFRSRK